MFIIYIKYNIYLKIFYQNLCLMYEIKLMLCIYWKSNNHKTLYKSLDVEETSNNNDSDNNVNNNNNYNFYACQ